VRRIVLAGLGPAGQFLDESRSRGRPWLAPWVTSRSSG